LVGQLWGKMTEMTKKSVLDACVENGLWRNPAINDKLYLQYQGYHEIKNLEAYTAVKALWLEGNGLARVENLGHMKELRCLYLQQNAIEELGDGLAGLGELDTLVLSNNYISKVSGLRGHAPKLNTLQLAHNKLETTASLEELRGHPTISVLDLSNNKLTAEKEDAGALIDLLASMPELAVLNLMGNPAVTYTKNYRKTLIQRCPKLGYLDDRPVFPEERECVAAFFEGGLEAERACRVEQRDRKEREQREQNESFRAMVNEARKAGPAVGANGFKNDPDDYSSGESESDEDEEPPELVRAFDALAQYPSEGREEEPDALRQARARGGATAATTNNTVTQSKPFVGGPAGLSSHDDGWRPPEAPGLSHVADSVAGLLGTPNSTDASLLPEDSKVQLAPLEEPEEDAPRPLGGEDDAPVPGAESLFQPADTFRGPVPGHVFKTGEFGVGYYRDLSQVAGDIADARRKVASREDDDRPVDLGDLD